MPGARREDRPARGRVLLIGAAFALVHLGLGLIALTDTRHRAATDVTIVYRGWIDQWHATGSLVGISTSWVYPIGALPPMIAADVAGDANYLLTWLVMITVLNAVALVFLTRRSVGLAWFWIAFTALLGPVALVRIDAVALPLVIFGVLTVENRPALASALFTLAAWVKVWPAALVTAQVIAFKRSAAALTAAGLTSVVVLGLAAAAGARQFSVLFSFVTAQTARGLQIESPVALPWLWLAAFGDRRARIYFDTRVVAYQIQAPGVPAVAAVMTPLLVAGVVVVVALGFVARFRGGPPQQVLALVALALVATLVTLNKVGSPQYATWLFAPVLLGLLVSRTRFIVPAAILLGMTGATQLIYPWLYGRLLRAEPLVLGVLTVRDVLGVSLLAWALTALAHTRASQRSTSDHSPAYSVER